MAPCPVPVGRRPCRPFRRSRVGWSWLPLVAGLPCWGFPCLFLLLRRLSCPPALRSRRGLVSPLAFLSARRPAPCLASWLLCGSLARWRRVVLRRPGVGACRPLVAVAWCARFPAVLRFLCRWRRFARWGAVAVPALWRLWLPVAPRRWCPLPSLPSRVCAVALSPAVVAGVVAFGGAPVCAPGFASVAFVFSGAGRFRRAARARRFVRVAVSRRLSVALGVAPSGGLVLLCVAGFLPVAGWRCSRGV